jgi:hypothetical protein
MDSEKLRKILRFDMWASAASVIFTIAGAGLLADWMGVSPWVPSVVGVALIPWVYTLWQTSRRTPLRTTEVGLVVAGNIGWAVIAAILLIGYPDALSTTGSGSSGCSRLLCSIWESRSGSAGGTSGRLAAGLVTHPLRYRAKCKDDEEQEDGYHRHRGRT